MEKVLVPDIGNYKDVPVIEVAVKAGDVVKAEVSRLVPFGAFVTLEEGVEAIIPTHAAAPLEAPILGPL